MVNKSVSNAGLALIYYTLFSDDIINAAFSYASMELKIISYRFIDK